MQHGPYIVASTRRGDDGKQLKEWNVETREAVSGKTLWTRKVRSERYRWYYTRSSNALSCVWDIDDEEGKELLKSDMKLRSLVDVASSKKKGIKILEVLDQANGQRRFAFPIDTGQGSIRISQLSVVNDVVLMKEAERVTLFDSTGRRRGRLFASRSVLDPAGKRMAAQTEPGRIGIYSAYDMSLQHTFTFSGPVAYVTFSQDGKNLLVLTADQTVYSFQIA